jgi:hypothetical protein
MRSPSNKALTVTLLLPWTDKVSPQKGEAFPSPLYPRKQTSAVASPHRCARGSRPGIVPRQSSRLKGVGYDTPMSAWVISGHAGGELRMSALPPKADINWRTRVTVFVQAPAENCTHASKRDRCKRSVSVGPLQFLNLLPERPNTSTSGPVH